jgi:hypothetical protein
VFARELGVLGGARPLSHFGMSCFCLFGKKRPAANSSDEHSSVVTGGAAAKESGQGHAVPRGSNDTAALSAAQTEVQTSPNQQETAAPGGDHARKGARDGVFSQPDLNGHVNGSVPAWVQKEPKSGALAQGHENIGVIGEVGSMHHGTGNFDTRATPRTVFRPAAHLEGRTSESEAPAAGRPPRPSRDAALAKGRVPSSQAQFDPIQEGYSEPLRNGRWTTATAAQEELVRDGDVRCKPGADVAVSEKWLQVPYFTQFKGLKGKLTRRGVNGAVWFASFPGHGEQNFNTGMHGQYILCYAPDRLPAAADKQATDLVDDAKQTQDAVADSSRALASDAPLAAPRGASKNFVSGLGNTKVTKVSARGQLSARQLSARQLSARQLSARVKERPPSARSRLAMGQYPLDCLGCAWVSVACVLVWNIHVSGVRLYCACCCRVHAYPAYVSCKHTRTTHAPTPHVLLQLVVLPNPRKLSQVHLAAPSHPSAPSTLRPPPHTTQELLLSIQNDLDACQRGMRSALTRRPRGGGRLGTWPRGRARGEASEWARIRLWMYGLVCRHAMI